MQKQSAIIAIFILFSFQLIKAQNKNSAYDYLVVLGEELNKTSEAYLKYASTVAHSKSARKAEKRRNDLIKKTATAKSHIASLKCFEDDCALRDSMVSFLNINYLVLKEDYEKILNMEEIAEQSYDQMEAYLMARKKANEKVEIFGNRVDIVYRDFAAKHSITLSDKPDKMSKQLEQVNRVNDHYNDVFLLFFKASIQEKYMLDAISRKDISSAEQNKNALGQVSAEGMGVLDTLKAYKNDKTMILACRKTLDFFKSESQDKIEVIINYLMKTENFEKLNTAFKGKNSQSLTKEEVNEYNKAVNEMNAATKNYNNIINVLNQTRTNAINYWNNNTTVYMQRYIPKVD